ncbi:MAG TPA: substrate-binding domain-containing protein [Polyangiaceae bacterium]|nr:substrate-binding domain-containing protein [Polyangiaceae bacterium]
MNTPIRLAILVDNLLSRYQIRLFKSALRIARSRGVRLIGFQARPVRGEASHPASFDGSFLFELAKAPAVDAMIVVTTVLASPVGTEAIRSFCAKSSVPVVSVGALPGVPHIDVENATGLRTVIEHLVTDHGRRNMAFIRGHARNPDSMHRERIFRDTLSRLGIPISEERILSGNFLAPSGTSAVRTLFDERGVDPADVDALVAANDQMAAGAIQELTMRRLRVPEDIAVVGFDDDDFARNCSPPLTTVAQPVERLGARAVELALDLLAGRPVRERTVLGTGPMFRASCGCRPHRSRPVPPPIEAASLEPALAECEAVAFRRLGKLVGAREEAPEIDGLTQALLATDEVDRRAALAAFERAVLRSAELGVDPLRWDHVIAPYVEAVDRFAEAYPANGERYRRRLLRVQLLINEVAARTQALSRMNALQRANAIRVLGSALASATSIPTLRKVLEAGLSGLGVRYCCVCLFVDPVERTASTVLLHHLSTTPGSMDLMESEAHMWESLPDSVPPTPMLNGQKPLVVASRALIPDASALAVEGGNLLVYALVSGESPLGYAMFSVPELIEDAWMFEGIVGHLSSGIYSVMAAQELRRAREAAERAGASSRELVTRMAHEVFAPLKDIRKHLEVCLQRELTASQRDHLERARLRSDALLHAVDDIVLSAKV